LSLGQQFPQSFCNFQCLPSACLKALHVEKAAYEGLMACFKEGWTKPLLGRFDTGRRMADRDDVAIDRKKVRGTERASVRRESIVDILCEGRWECQES
jgi:hypothetical protein